MTCVYVNPGLDQFWLIDYRIYDPEGDGRSKLDHRRADVEERLNLQREGAKAKPYQVRQVRAMILKYRLEVDDDI